MTNKEWAIREIKMDMANKEEFIKLRAEATAKRNWDLVSLYQKSIRELNQGIKALREAYLDEACPFGCSGECGSHDECYEGRCSV